MIEGRSLAAAAGASLPAGQDTDLLPDGTGATCLVEVRPPCGSWLG